jgi:hypothetical protein
MTAPRPPKGTGPAGRRLWSSIVSVYRLEEHELALLREAARTADICAGLQDIVDEQGPMVGSPARTNPALVELRQQRIVLTRMIVSLRVPIGDQEDAPRTQYRGTRGAYHLRSVR